MYVIIICHSLIICVGQYCNMKVVSAVFVLQFRVPASFMMNVAVDCMFGLFCLSQMDKLWVSRYSSLRKHSGLFCSLRLEASHSKHEFSYKMSVIQLQNLVGHMTGILQCVCKWLIQLPFNCTSFKTIHIEMTRQKKIQNILKQEFLNRF